MLYLTIVLWSLIFCQLSTLIYKDPNDFFSVKLATEDKKLSVAAKFSRELYVLINKTSAKIQKS
ncbi:hypothetical protein HALO59_170105 [Halomonas sp. 59]|nr:hypothetical protein HALO156_10286 [Halomonas sp. 156]CAD5264807.1 hypothetical protein HALO113_160942 [Halomonas sp. 113]CAD5267150.1 hypothetical protein HALO59_170105 [Halomonas sp. 59]CAD5279472.1 hypothetical protein HALOI3_210286 [Halomonas sp. I3]VXB59377.1 hypothetical protein HALO98_170287 [Halomonas titanicae]